MLATAQELIDFIEQRVLTPVEKHLEATRKMQQKINGIRIRLNSRKTTEKVKSFFWTYIVSDVKIIKYLKMTAGNEQAFEDVRTEFRALCERN